jgi:uncharacterized membrane protein HdeD (DUF308 family)
MVHETSRESLNGPAAAAAPADPIAGVTRRLGASWSTALTVGLVTLLLGIIIVAWPEATVGVVAVLFGIQLLLFGIFNLVRSIAADEAGGGVRLLYALLGVLSIALGVLAMRHLLQTVAVLAVLVGLTWLLGGIIEFVNLVAEPARPGRAWAMALAALAALAGIVVLAYPTPSLVTLTVLVGIWLIIWGALTALLAFAVRHAAVR